MGIDKYSPANVSPFEFSNPELRRDVIQEASEQVIGVAKNGQQFSGIYVNRAFASEGATFVRINSLFGSTANADQQYIATQYAAAFPGSGYLSIDLPAHGASDKLTEEQRKSIKASNGSLHKVAEAQIEAAMNIAPHLGNIILTGEAMGELLATEFAVQAPAKDITVRRLFGFDPLGLEPRFPVELFGSYLISAQKSRFRRRKKADRAGEQALEDAYSKVFVPELETFGQVKYATQPSHARLLSKEWTIARMSFKKKLLFTIDSGPQALDKALGANPQMQAYLVFASKSAVGRPTEKVKRSLAAIKQRNQGRLQVDEWPNDNQDIGLARHQPRLIRYIMDNL
jgi:pimeloyl-ACP methyl ester carboxylesterase